MTLSDESERELREAIRAYVDDLGKRGIGFIDVKLTTKFGPLLESRDNAIAERDRRIAELEEVLRDVACQYGIVNNGKLWSQGSTLDSVFDAIGWSNPCDAPKHIICDEPKCKKHATCGWPSLNGYRRTCQSQSIPAAEANSA